MEDRVKKVKRTLFSTERLYTSPKSSHVPVKDLLVGTEYMTKDLGHETGYFCVSSWVTKSFFREVGRRGI